MTITILEADVELIAPELQQAVVDTAAMAGVSASAIWTAFLATTDSQCGQQCDEAQTDLDWRARYLCAHLVTNWCEAFKVKGTGGTGGAVSQIGIGPATKQFAVPEAWSKAAMVDAMLTTTRYGREYLRLQTLAVGVPMLIV